MRRLLKILFGTVFAFAVVVALAVILLVTVVNPNDFKDKISKLVYQETGRTLVVNGDMSWRFFPWLGLKVKDVNLSNPKGFVVQDFADIGEADVEVRLLPLLSKRLDVGRLVLKDAKLHFVTDASGGNNWQDLLQPKSVEKSGDVVDANKNMPVAAKAAAVPFFIGNLDIVNSKLTYQNRITSKSFAVSKLNFSADNISLRTPFDFSLDFAFNTSKPELSGTIKLQSEVDIDMPNNLYSLKDFELSGGYKDANLTKNIPFSMRANVAVDLNKQLLNVAGWKFSLANISGNGVLQGEKIVDDPIVAGKLDVKIKKMNQFLAFFKGIAPLKKDIAASALNFEFQASPKFAKISNIVANLGSMRLNGKVNFTDFAKKNMNFALRVNKLDLARYASVAKATTNKNASKQDVTGFLAAPALMNLEGSLKIAKLQLAKLAMQNVAVHVVGKNRVLNFDQLDASLYKGALRSNVRVDVSRRNPRFNANAVLTKISLQPLLSDMSNMKKLTGTANLKVKLNSSGANLDAILRDLDGRGTFNVRNGIWHGVDVRYQINMANSIINNRTRPTKSNPPQTKFGKLTGSFIISNGLLRNNDFLVASPHYRVDGQGTVNLISQTLDYRLEAAGMQTVTDEYGRKVDRPTDFAVPIRVTGPVADPNVRPDLGNLIKRAAVQEIKKALTKKIGEHLGRINTKNPGELIKGLKLDGLFR